MSDKVYPVQNILKETINYINYNITIFYNIPNLKLINVIFTLF